MAASAATPLFPPDALRDALAQREPDVAALLALADALAAAHARAEPVAGNGSARVFKAVAAGDAQLAAAQTAELDRHAAHLDARARAGRVRRIDGEPRDVLRDLAAPLAALWADGLVTQASIVANRYVDIAPQGATGWALLPLLLSLATEEAARAAQALRPSPPRLVAIGGLSGTGKTTLARLLASRIGRPPGGRVLRSDVFRKRVAGVPPETRLPPSRYTRRSDEETFEALFESAEDHLACGSSVILDAVFIARSERDVAQMLAERARVPFTGIWLEAPERDRVARVTERIGDASDAGAEVARDQSRRPVGELAGWHRIRTNRPLELIVAAARAALDRARR